MTTRHRVELRTRPEHFHAFSGRSVLVTNLDGWINGPDLEGFYYENTRLLSCARLSANGKAVTGFAGSPVGGDGFLAYATLPQELSIAERGAYLTLAYFVGEGLFARLRFENDALRESVRYRFALELAADFADMEELEQGKREQTGPVDTIWDAARQELLFRYRQPELDRAVAIRIEAAPAPVVWEGGALTLDLELRSHQPVELCVAVEPIFDGQRLRPPSRTFGETITPLDRLRRQLREEIPRLTTTNSSVARAWQTATEDLAWAPLGLEPGPAAPIAGLPRYVQLFGRDTLTISWQALTALPTMLRDALKLNAAWQGTKIDDWYDEEPGKLIHQARRGPLSVLGKDPYLHYYGDYTTPQDFLAMLGQYVLWTGDLETAREVLPTARAALIWLSRFGDLDGDGFLEYVTRSSMGLKNQGWKDSGDAIVYPDGRIVPDPIATCEIQAYWYAALRQIAWVFLLCGDLGYALELRQQARTLQRHFNQAFWMEDEGYCALGLDPDKRQIRTIASNASQCLVTGILPPERARQVAQRLLAPDLFSGWGIRTLSSEHPSYNPFSYHLGSVWPVSSGTFAFGLARYGCWEELDRLAEGLFDASDLFVGNRLPEVLGGVSRDADHPHPGMYPQSDEPQGWSDSAVIMTIQALLGMRAIAPLDLLLLDPHLPPWLPDLRFEGLRVGSSLIDLDLRCARDGATRYHVTHRQGPIRVLRQPTPDSPTATLAGRMAALAQSIISH